MLGKEVEKTDLTELRSQICVLTGNPFFFRGTLDENLDSSGKFDIDTKVELIEYLKTMDLILEQIISDQDNTNVKISQKERNEDPNITEKLIDNICQKMDANGYTENNAPKFFQELFGKKMMILENDSHGGLP